MKIWVIGRGIPTKNNRMMGSFELGQAKIIARNHDVTYAAQVFTFNPRNGNNGFTFSERQEGNVKVFDRTVFYFPGRLHLHNKSYINYQWKTFLKRIERVTGCPDIIHIHYPARTGASEVFETYKKRGVKIVCTEHWTHVLTKQLDNYELGQLQKYVFLADSFISVGAPLKKAIEDLVETKREIRIIPNFVESFFCPYNREESLSRFEFINVGRLVKVKQVDKVIAAFNNLLQIRKDIHLTIVGDGEEYEKLVDEVNRLNIEKYVTFTGTLNRHEVAKTISRSNCLICFSNCETFGVPIVEAWFCGIPAISSDALGFSEYWTEGLGFIVNQNDIDLLTTRMNDIISYDYDPTYIRNYADKHFSEDSIRKQIENEYYRIVERI